MSIDLLEPVLNVIESCLLATIINKKDAHCSLVVSLSDCTEPLLAGCVPNLELDLLIQQIYGFNSEIDSNRGHVTCGELIIGEPEQQTSFPDG